LELDSKRLRLQCEEPLSNFAFNFNSRRYMKEYVCDKEAMTHLITFADNNAVGYFQKQGFTKVGFSFRVYV
jgi:hypothetical protein